MGKIKQWVAESKARKELGEERYYALREEFLNVFNSICSSLIGDNEGRKIVRELKQLKEKMWLDNLFKFLGTAMLVVSIWRSDMYSLKETIAGCATGVIFATVAQLKTMYANRCYDEKKDELIDYVTSKANKKEGISLGETKEEEMISDSTLRVVYKDATEDLIY